MRIPLYVICWFSLAAFNIFSLNLIFVTLINMCLVFFSQGLSCMGLSLLFGLGWLFPFPCQGSFLFVCLFVLTSLLESNCFTMVCQFLLHNKVNQLSIYIYPHISSLLRFPPSLGNFLTIIFLNIFSDPFFFSSSSGTSII